jgi:hypothetical protein
MEIEAHKLPIAGFAREITLVARERELGDLPAVFATHCAEVLSKAIAERLPKLPPGSFRRTDQVKADVAPGKALRIDI